MIYLGMALDVIVGLQRGDEGKGRFVDLVAGEYSIIARGNGGSNAGHTVVPDSLEPLALHQIPSGIAYPDTLNIIGNGVYVDPRRLVEEIKDVRATGITVSAQNLLISDIAHLVLPHHIALDALREEGTLAQGSTKSGIAFVASDKYLREGVRLELIATPRILYEHALQGLQDLQNRLPKDTRKSVPELEVIARDWLAATESLREYMADTVTVINDRLRAGDKVLAEGAQAYLLDINHGMYPAVTSSSTTVSGLLDGLGVAPKHLGKVTGVAKAVKSHVGGGPLVTEVTDEAIADKVRGIFGAADSEYGATTQRARRIGYPDLVELRNAIRVNGVDELVLSKLDHVPRYGDTIQVATSYTYQGQERRTAPSSAIALTDCRPNYQSFPTWSQDISGLRDYDQLPAEAQNFVQLFANELEVPVKKVGVGPQRQQVILL